MLRYLIPVLAAFPALAEEVAVPGNEIHPLLADTTLRYEAAVQTFYRSGRTLYDDGQPSWGYWEVRGDAYCSQWPPQAGWACYQILQDPARPEVIVFVGESGTRYPGQVTDPDR
ncbi:MAG: hypothetical protein AAFR17_19990 [Pseudomonadota bacterium]